MDYYKKIKGVINVSTQGLISIMKDKSVIVKVICGCDGYNAKKVARIIEKRHLEKIQDIYDVALENGFGCSDCLVVMNKTDIVYKGDGDIDSHPLFRETFNNPSFNPRWECGSVENLVIIGITKKQLDIFNKEQRLKSLRDALHKMSVKDLELQHQRIMLGVDIEKLEKELEN